MNNQSVRYASMCLHLPFQFPYHYKRYFLCKGLLGKGKGLLGIVLPCIGILCWNNTYALEANGKAYRFGVFPFQPPRIIEQIYAKEAKALSKALQQPVRLITASSFEKFQQRLENRDYDFILVQPFDYINIAAKYNYKPIARFRENLSAVFITGRDSPIQTLSDLENQTIAFPPESAAVSLLAMYDLKKQGLIPDKIKNLLYTKNHSYCLNKVRLKKAASCVTTLEALPVSLKTSAFSIKVIHKTQAIPHVLYAAKKELPGHIHNKLKEFMTTWTKHHSMANDEEPLVPIYIPAFDSDYDSVRRLQKELLQ